MAQIDINNEEKEKKIKSIMRRLQNIDKDLIEMDCILTFTGENRNNATILSSKEYFDNSDFDSDCPDLVDYYVSESTLNIRN